MNQLNYHTNLVFTNTKNNGAFASGVPCFHPTIYRYSLLNSYPLFLNIWEIKLLFMKKILLTVLTGLAVNSYSQQNISNSFLGSTENFSTEYYMGLKKAKRDASTATMKKGERKTLVDFKKNDANSIKLPVAGLFGASNLNEESFKSLNASGKASFYFRPAVYRNKALTIYASYNINATNNDSILYSTLIFPEVGTNSFLGTVEWRSFWSTSTVKGKSGHSIAPFFEFSHKNIRTDSIDKGKAISFATLNYTVGFKYTFNVFRNAEDEKENGTEASLFASAYLSFLNIPDEDIDNYRAILSKGQSIDRY
jgi:hypothetical protein